MLELEDTLHHFRSTSRLLHLHRSIVLGHDGLLLSKVTLATENQVRTATRDLHIQLLTEGIHITADLLQVHRRHVDDVREVQVRDLDLIHIRVEEFEEVVRHRGLFRVLHANSEFIGIGRRQIERERIIVAHCLDQLEEVDHIHAQNVLRRAIKVLKTVMVQTQIYENRVSLIHRHHLNSILVKLQIRLRQDLLECFNECAECASLNCADFKEVSICVGFGGAHLMAGVTPALSK